MHIVEKASDRWYMFKHEFESSWKGLSELLMREFSDHSTTDSQAALARMSQSGSVEQFVDQFTKMSRRTTGFSHELLLNFFIGGLKESIRTDVRLQKPKTLYDAYELAKLFEARESSNKQFSRTTFG